MSYLAAFLIVAAAAGAAALATLIVARLTALGVRQRHHAVGGHVFQQVGVMFSVLLAFVFSEVWSEYNVAAQAINRECGALHGAALLANTLSTDGGRQIVEDIVAYGAVVTGQEWQEMAHRRSSPQARAAFRTAFDRAARLKSADPREIAVQSQILALFSQAHSERETRTFEMTQSVPAALWAVLIALAVLLDLFVLFADVEGVGHILFAAGFAGSTVMVLVLVRMLDFPFEGALALSDGDFVKMTGEAAALAVAGR